MGQKTVDDGDSDGQHDAKNDLAAAVLGGGQWLHRFSSFGVVRVGGPGWTDYAIVTRLEVLDNWQPKSHALTWMSNGRGHVSGIGRIAASSHGLVASKTLCCDGCAVGVASR